MQFTVVINPTFFVIYHFHNIAIHNSKWGDSDSDTDSDVSRVLSEALSVRSDQLIKKWHSHEEYSEQKWCFSHPAIRRVIPDFEKVQGVLNIWQSHTNKLDTTDQNRWEQNKIITSFNGDNYRKFQEKQQKSNQTSDRKMCKNHK